LICLKAVSETPPRRGEGSVMEGDAGNYAVVGRTALSEEF
jgi:hypothetical protein